MTITTKLELRQSQSLVMTPQLQQAIKLLQLSNVELAAFVETELERNPLLEHAESEEGAPVNGETSEAALNLFKEESGDGEGASPAPDVDAPEGDGDWLDLQADDKVRADELDTEPHDAFADAEHLAGALDDVLTGRRAFDAALGDWHRARDEAVHPMYEFTAGLATLEPPPPEQAQLFGAAAGNREAMDAFAKMFAGVLPVPEFFAPENVERILGAAAA